MVAPRFVEAPLR